MPAPWTKADYDNAYSYRVERYFGGHPNTRDEVRVHYHKWAKKPIVAAMWAAIQPVLSIQAADFVCVIGAGFGWGVEACVAETGATVVGIDISQYIADEQANTEEAELRAEIAAVGLDPDSGRGAELLAILNDGQPRANVIVLQNDASTGPQRQAIRTALGGNWPSVCVAEDLIDDAWTDAEIQQLRDSMNGFGGAQRLIFVYDGTPARSQQNVLDLLPGSAEIISTDGQRYIQK